MLSLLIPLHSLRLIVLRSLVDLAHSMLSTRQNTLWQLLPLVAEQTSLSRIFLALARSNALSSLDLQSP